MACCARPAKKDKEQPPASMQNERRNPLELAVVWLDYATSAATRGVSLRPALDSNWEPSVPATLQLQHVRMQT